MDNKPANVSFAHEDRQWDARFNVQDDESLNAILDGIKAERKKENSNTYLLEVQKLELDHIKTIIKSDTYMWPSFLIIVPPSQVF